MTEVSVIVPIYNSEKSLKKCIHSITVQTLKNIEIILVDDGSTDKSGQICDSLKDKDSRITVIHQKNQGSIAARRHGIEKATGKYICFCDSDDTLANEALRIMMDEIYNSESDICVGKMDRCWKGVHMKGYVSPCLQIDRPVVYDHERFMKELYISWFGTTNVPVALCGKIFKAELIKNAYYDTPDLGVFLGDDLIVTLSAFPKAKKVVFIPDVIYYYTVGGGTSSFRPNMLDEWIKLYNYKIPFAKKYIPESEAQKYADIELCNMTFTYLEMLFERSCLSRAQFEEKIKEALERPEIKNAALNPMIDIGKSINVRMIREGNVQVIYDAVKQRLDSTAYSRKIKSIIRKL
ncbi:MAG: glycosyltransferase family 2 protein [Acutalibacteraceae bacterium]